MLSYHFIGSLQTGHFEEGKTIDSLESALKATTFKKLPIQAPTSNINIQIKKTSNIIKFFPSQTIYSAAYSTPSLTVLKPAFEIYPILLRFEFDSYPQNNLKPQPLAI